MLGLGKLIERCEWRLQKISESKDCGFYAELYKQDVAELLAIIKSLPEVQCLSNSK